MLSLGLDWPDPLQGLSSLKRCHEACSCSKQAGHSQPGLCPGRLEARSEACSALSLKPEQDYLISLAHRRGFPGDSEGTESACNAQFLIPGSGSFPGGGNDNPLQYSCLEKPMDRGAWWAIVHGASRVGLN